MEGEKSPVRMLLDKPRGKGHTGILPGKAVKWSPGTLQPQRGVGIFPIGNMVDQPGEIGLRPGEQ